METIRLKLNELKTQQAALEEFKKLEGMPGYYACNLDSLYEILTEWSTPLKLEIEVGGDISAFSAMLGMLEDARKENDRLLFVVIAER